MPTSPPILSDALATPWRIANELRRLLALPAIRLAFALHGIAWGRGWRCMLCRR